MELLTARRQPTEFAVRSQSNARDEGRSFGGTVPSIDCSSVTCGVHNMVVTGSLREWSNRMDLLSLKYVNFKTKPFIRLVRRPESVISVGWGQKKEPSADGKTAGPAGFCRSEKT